MIDQRVSEGEKINFFDQMALTTTLPAQLSIKFNLDIIPVYIERDKDDNFKIEFQKPVNVKEFGNKIELTKELNKILEKMIIKNPGQWIWTIIDGNEIIFSTFYVLYLPQLRKIGLL